MAIDSQLSSMLGGMTGDFENIYKGFYPTGQRPDWALSPEQLAAQKMGGLGNVQSNRQSQQNITSGTSGSQSASTQYPVALVASRKGAARFNQALQDLSGQVKEQMTPYTNLGAGAANQWARLLGIPAGGMQLTTQEAALDQQNNLSTSLGGIQQSLDQLATTTDPEERNQIMQSISGNLQDAQSTYQQPTGDASWDNQTTDMNAQMSTIQQALENTPGYQFRKEQGMKAVMQGMAGKGMRKSGQAMKELMEYGQGLASQEYNSLLDQYSKAAGFGGQMLTGSQQMQTSLGRAGAEAGLTASQEFRRGPASMHSTSSSQSSNLGISGGSSKGQGISFKR